MPQQPAAVNELRRWCDEHPSFEVASSGGSGSVLVRLAPPAHAEDIADEVYTLVATNVVPCDGVVLTHEVVDGRAALELAVVDPSVDTDALRSVIDQIGAESERLIGLWHPDLPDSGA